MSEAALAPPPGALRERVAAYLRDLVGDPDEVHAAIAALGEADLERFGLRACHLNLLTLFGGQRPPEWIRSAAAACARTRLWRGWSHNVRYRESNLAVMGDGRAADAPLPVAAPALAGWEAARAAGVLGRPGVLFCGFHFGSYRFVCTDLAHLGVPVTFAADTRGMEDTRRGSAGEVPGFGGGFRVAAIDEPGGLVTLIRAMRRGTAYLNVDAHRGWGAGHTEASHCRVRFLGHTLRVMTGAARLAAANGAVLVPVAALPDGPRPGRVVLGDPVAPPSGGADDPAWVGAAMQAVYEFFAPLVEADPAEWQDVRFLHRWREPDPPAPAPERGEGAVRALDRALAAGAVLRLDPARALVLEGGGAPSVTDARTLQSFQPPAWAGETVRALAGPAGVSAGWLRDRFPARPERRRALSLIAALEARGLVPAAAS